MLDKHDISLFTFGDFGAPAAPTRTDTQDRHPHPSAIMDTDPDRLDSSCTQTVWGLLICTIEVVEALGFVVVQGQGLKVVLD